MFSHFLIIQIPIHSYNYQRQYHPIKLFVVLPIRFLVGGSVKILTKYNDECHFDGADLCLWYDSP